MTYLTVIGFCV